MTNMKTKITTGCLLGLLSATLLAADGVEDFKSALTAKLASFKESAPTVIPGKDGWLFLPGELRHLSVGPFWGEAASKVSKATNPAAADPLPAILDFKAQLDKAGVALIMVPVPAKSAIYPEKIVDGAINSPTQRLDAADAEFNTILKKNGIDVVDLAPLFLKARSEHPEELLYSKEDTHWSGYGIRIAADEIAKKLSVLPGLTGKPHAKFTGTSQTINVVGDLASQPGDAKSSPETLVLTKVSDANGAPVASFRQSPIVLLGDSHNLIYSIGEDMLATGCGLPENLALKCGISPDVVAVRGSGATPARMNLARRGDNLAGKKVIVWCFTVREFTEGQGWRRVPVIRP